MRRNKNLFIITIILFVSINTSYYWKWYIGLWGAPIY